MYDEHLYFVRVRRVQTHGKNHWSCTKDVATSIGHASHDVATSISKTTKVAISTIKDTTE